MSERRPDAVGADPAAEAKASAGRGRHAGVPERPVLPTRAAEDSARAWGDVDDAAGDSNDERLLRDRPPHWDE